MADDDASRPVLEDRGEITLTLDGQQLGMRPSYEAIDAVERALGRGLIDIARDALSAKLSLGETAQVACEFVRAWGREAENKGAASANPARIGKLILDSEAGFHGTLQPLSAVLSLAVTGGYDSSGNLRPATKTTTA